MSKFSQIFTSLSAINVVFIIAIVLHVTSQTDAVSISDAEVCRQKDKECTVLHEWVKLDFLWPNQTMRDDYMKKGLFDPTHCYLSGVKLYKEQIFVTVPRLRYHTGVPSVLNKVVIDPADNKTKLEPFPNWEIQKQGSDCDNLQMGMSIEIDPVTGYLYIIDPGRPGIVGTPNPKTHKCPPKLVIFDINDGSKVRSIELPSSVASIETNFLNDIVLDRGDPSSLTVRWVYITDAIDSKLYVIDLETNETRGIHHHSMDYEIENSTITVNNRNYTLALPIDGLAMTRDFKYVYYCALGSFKLWRVPTFVLRDATYNFGDYAQFVGNKISQTGGMIYATHSLYYGALSKSAVYQWDVKRAMEHQNTSEGKVKIESELQLAKDDDKMVWPDAFAIDENGYMYVTACRANLFLKGGMDFNGGAGSNYRIWKFNIGELGYLSPLTPNGSTVLSYGPIGYLFLLIMVPISLFISSMRYHDG